MFSFIDSSSDHGTALSHFHSYALFFLVLVIVFVIWLLKMVLNFTVAERDVRKVPTETLMSVLPNGNSFNVNVVSLIGKTLVFQHFVDVTVALFTVKNITKIRKTYSAIKTLYPDQGNIINVFCFLPRLFLRSDATYRRPYFPGSLTTLFLAGGTEHSLAVKKTFRANKHNIPFIFPYERIEIPSHGTYSCCESYLTIGLYKGGYALGLQFASYARTLKHYKFKNKGWYLAVLNVKDFLGFSVESDKFAYKKFYAYSMPYLLFTEFYNTDTRTFFYLFFQHVRHRKTLEWVWTCVPAGILMLLLYPSLLLLYAYDRPYITKPYLTFKAIGHQWYWSYEYSDFVTTTDSLREHIKFDSYMLHEDDLEVGSFRLLEVDRRIVLPIGICMRLVTTSSDVLHSWAVPAMGVKIDAIPGRLNQFWIVADRPGTFYGQCSELCGVNHGFMPIAVEGAPFLEFFKAVATIEGN